MSLKKRAKKIVKDGLVSMGTGLGALAGKSIIESLLKEKKKEEEKDE